MHSSDIFIMFQAIPSHIENRIPSKNEIVLQDSNHNTYMWYMRTLLPPEVGI